MYKKDLSSYTSPDPTPEGRWLYKIIPNSGEKVAISVKVTSKSRDPNSDPILTKCWIATGSQQINSETDLKLSVVADVRQGNDPVIGAKVKAIVEMPSANGNDYPPMEMELPDSGAGADFIKNDGIYSRYLAKPPIFFEKNLFVCLDILRGIQAKGDTMSNAKLLEMMIPMSTVASLIARRGDRFL